MSFAPPARRLIAGACLLLSAAGVVLSVVGATAVGAVALLIAGSAGAFGWLVTPAPDGPPPAEMTQDLVARMSHELRTPLTSVMGLLDVLHGDEPSIDDEERTELLHLAKVEANRMEHLVTNLHTAARLARDVVEPQPEPVTLAPLVAEIVDRFPGVARRTYLPSGDLRAHADPRLAAQIITNLIQNVDRYAPTGELAIGIERRGNQVALVFSDDGPGIDEARWDGVFDPASSAQGLGIGLSLSRELAEAMGGGLGVETSRRRGATFALTLPHTSRPASHDPDVDRNDAVPVVAHSPRARLLVDLAAAFAERSLDRTMAGIHRLYVELLGATGTALMLPVGDAFQSISGRDRQSSPLVSDATLSHVLRTGVAVEFNGIANAGAPDWQAELNGRAAVALPVIDGVDVVGVLVVAFNSTNAIPANRAGHLATALAQLAAFAIHRSALVRDVAFERTLRSSVMEALPIAISVFAGDPPTVVDWNQREREMLGLPDDSLRPSDLTGSQRRFDVRFADGTPLTVENAPVTAAIRTGRSAGPFLLNIRRIDGTQVTTRTYCAPFFSEDGSVAGAVVTSEELDVTPPPQDDTRHSSSSARAGR